MARLAICIGINDYPGTESDLSGCVNDANDWGGVLSSRQFSITKLIDGAATKQAIVDAIGGVISQAKSGDSIVVTFSGHGSWQPDGEGDEDDGRDEGWCPHDIRSSGLLTDDQMFSMFGRLKMGVKLVVISDSCHSGTVTRSAMDATPEDLLPRIRFMPPSKFLSKSHAAIAEKIGRGGGQLVSKPDRALLLSGCLDHEYSLDTSFGGRPNGVFTYHAIQTLKKLSRSSTYTEWYNLVRRYLPNSSFPQTPNLLGSLSQCQWKIFE